MIKFGAVLDTDGSGYWSNVAKSVKCTGIDIGYVNDEKDFAELRVYFDTASWDVSEDGLIYTDRQFITELKEALVEASIDSTGVSYSEQGMQGDDYVSLDVGKEFIDSLMEIAPEVFYA
ncbi:hypothetical protein UFOVP71_59 [uncultured Caudovirales phage]|uniref:Uncharacterized protein n=1 Tax=uncultured Caudovirales phage TaxID=2100421 RepID=A0A6J5TA95_9CAUD|nr:hypothetical protein UFOVP71_59 [uncultured Caudovirales phage]